jgi:hypothetical protein
MVIRSLSRAEVREVDRRAIEEYGVSGLVLTQIIHEPNGL